MIRGIIKKLTDTAGVTNLVPATRIYPVVATQDVDRPYITIRRIGASPQIVKTQNSDTDAISFNVTVYSAEYKECINILYAVRTAMDGFKGASEGVNFHKIFYETSQDLFNEEDNSFVIVDTYTARVSRI